MSKWKALWKTVRPLNLLIMALTMVGVYGAIFNQFDEIDLDHLLFGILTLSIVLLGAGGNIINDIEDVQVDAINKPGKNQVGIGMTRSWAMNWYLVLTFLGLVLGLIASVLREDLHLTLIVLFISTSLWLYSRWLQKQVLVGNLVVAVLCGLLPIIPAIFYEGALIENEEFIRSQFGSQRYIYAKEDTLFISRFYAYFSFGLTLLREQLKDIEDVEGDGVNSYLTLPVRYGILSSKRLILWEVMLFVTFLFFLIAVVILSDLIPNPYNQIILISVFTSLLIPIAYFSIKVNSIQSPTQASIISKWLKFSMALGIATTAFFWFL